jgi:hypothetical protein
MNQNGLQRFIHKRLELSNQEFLMGAKPAAMQPRYACTVAA